MLAFLFCILFPLAVWAQIGTELLSNAGFESSTQNVLPWTCGMSPGVASAPSTTPCGVETTGTGHYAQSGSSYATLNQGGYIQQSTNATAGAVYYLQFWAYLVDGFSPNGEDDLQVVFNPTGYTAWNHSVPQAVYIGVGNGTDSTGPYSLYSFNLTAQGNDILRFTLATTSLTTGSSLRLDSVSLTLQSLPPASATATPGTTGGHSNQGSGSDTGALSGLGVACVVAAGALIAAGVFYFKWRAAIRTAKEAENNAYPVSPMGMNEAQFSPGWTRRFTPSLPRHSSTNPPSSAGIPTPGVSSFAGLPIPELQPASPHPESSSPTPPLPTYTPKEPEVVQKDWDPLAADVYPEFPQRTGSCGPS